MSIRLPISLSIALLLQAIAAPSWAADATVARATFHGADTAASDDTPTIDLPATIAISSDWDSGYCANLSVVNLTATAIRWRSSVAVDGSIDLLWNAVENARSGTVSFSGTRRNADLGAGETARFGYCATRGSDDDVAAPAPTEADRAPAAVQTELHIDSDWSAGYCAHLDVRNRGPAALEWHVAVPIEGQINAVWNAEWAQSGGTLSLSGLNWNRRLDSDHPLRVDFCAIR